MNLKIKKVFVLHMVCFCCLDGFPDNHLEQKKDGKKTDFSYLFAKIHEYLLSVACCLIRGWLDSLSQVSNNNVLRTYLWASPLAST